MLIPTPDSLPAALPSAHPQTGPDLGQKFQNLEPVSSIRKKGILQLLPMFRKKNALPVDGTILTEEQYNALSGQSVMMPMPAPPQQVMQPVPETQLPPATQVPQPVQQMQPHASAPVQQGYQQVPTHQVRFSGNVPIHSASSVRYQTPVQPQTPQLGLIRDFAPKTFGDASQMNFGGAWGQKVSDANQVQQPGVATYGDPLEIPNIDESYDLWPQSPAESRVSQQIPPTSGTPAISNIPSVETFGAAPMMRVTDQSVHQAQQSEQHNRQLPLIVPAQKNQ